MPRACSARIAGRPPGNGSTVRMYCSFHSSPRYFFNASPNVRISRALERVRHRQIAALPDLLADDVPLDAFAEMRERLDPAVGVFVVGVDERAVDVEEDGLKFHVAGKCKRRAGVTLWRTGRDSFRVRWPQSTRFGRMVARLRRMQKRRLRPPHSRALRRRYNWLYGARRAARWRPSTRLTDRHGSVRHVLEAAGIAIIALFPDGPFPSREELHERAEGGGGIIASSR